MKPTVIAISCGKGGVGKTTTTANLAGALLLHGRGPVLTIDLDTNDAGISALYNIYPQATEKTVYHGLLEEGTDFASVIRPVRDRLDVVPANRDFAAAENFLMAMPTGGEFRLKEELASISNYPYIVLDCPPQLSRITVNALTAADLVIIPFEPSLINWGGLVSTLNTIQAVKNYSNRDIELFGILITKRREVKHAQEVEARLQEEYPGLIIDEAIPHTVRFQETPVAGLSLVEYDPRHPASIAYAEVTKKVIHHVEKANLTQPRHEQPSFS